MLYNNNNNNYYYYTVILPHLSSSPRLSPELGNLSDNLPVIIHLSILMSGLDNENLRTTEVLQCHHKHLSMHPA